MKKPVESTSWAFFICNFNNEELCVIQQINFRLLGLKIQLKLKSIHII